MKTLYCASCGHALQERILSGQQVWLCTTCGDIYTRTPEGKFKYLGTTHGNRNMRELLPLTDEMEVMKQNETVALETNTVT